MNARLCILAVSFFGQLLCGLALKCSNCKGTSNWSQCHVQTCSTAQTRCYATVQENRGSFNIVAGCTDEPACKTLTLNHSPQPVCHTCCVGNKCNENHCKPATVGGIYCRQCAIGHDDNQCDSTQHCSPGQVCFIQEFTAPRVNNVFYHGGCTDEANCQSVETRSFHVDYTLQQLQLGACCNTSDCNAPSILKHNHVNRCTTCVLEGVGWRCGAVDTCKANQVCYAQELELSLDIPGLQSTYFHAGCIDASTCHSLNQKSVSDEHGLARVIQGECCTTNNCNTNILAKYNTVQHCTKCVLDGVGWKCDEVDTCTKNEVCYAQELELTLAIPGLQATYFHGGCIDQSKCQSVNHQSVFDEHGLARVIQGECCNYTDCNTNRILKYKEQYSTTTKATTTTTTAATTTSTTTTTVTPTTTVTLTTPGKGQQCQVCTGSGCDAHAQLNSCPDLAPLCLTSVENDHLGNKTYTKRCASVNECDAKWLTETTVKPECIGFHPDSSYTFSFNCTFCCTTDGCNIDNMPSVNSLYFNNDEQ